MKWTAITSYGRAAGSARVRLFDWIDWTGIDAEVSSYVDAASNSPKVLVGRANEALMSELNLRQLASKVYDGTIFLSRQASPFSRGDLESNLLRSSGLGVYDFDDALYLSQNGGLFRKDRIWRRSVESADVIIAGNSSLAEEAAKFNGNVYIIPSCVNPSQYIEKKRYSLDDVPRAVWLGSPSTENYLRNIEAPLLRTNRSHGLRMTVVSAGSASLGRLDAMVDRVPWSLHGFSQELVRADFGVMPLVDSVWTRGKCAYKLLQYGAAGLPLIGSPVGANAEVLRKAQGYSPVSNDDWGNALVSILDESDTEREHRGKAALSTVSNYYSFQAWEGRWRDAVNLAL